MKALGLPSKANPAHAAARPGRGLASSWRGLIAQWFLITVFPLSVLLVVLTFGSLELHQLAMRKLVGERDLRALHTISAALTEQVVQRSAILNLLAARMGSSETGGVEINSEEKRILLEQFDNGVVVVDERGGVETITGNYALASSLANGVIPYIRQTVAQAAFPGTSTGIPPVTIQHPSSEEAILVVFSKDPSGSRVVVGGFTVESLASQILGTSFAGDHNISLLVVDRAGRTLYRMGDLFREGDKIDHPGIAESLQGLTGTTYLQSNGSEHVVAFSPVEELGWGLVSEEPWEMVDTPLLRTTQATPLVLAPMLLLALVALWFVARQVVQPLQQLESRSSELAGGNFHVIDEPVGGIMEIQRLQSGLMEMAHRLNIAQQTLHNYIQAITTAQEDERKRLARELHDETIQSLIALKQRVQMARLDAGQGAGAAQLNEIATMTEGTIEELRRLIRALRPIYLEDLGLVTALHMLTNEASQTAGIPVDFSVEGEERRLEAEVELSLYRIAQEALSNVARHAKASHATLSVGFFPDRIDLEVADNGLGFTAPVSRAEVVPDGHFGVLGLYERAELIGAELEVTSAPGEGTKISVQLSNTAGLRI